MLSPLGPPLGPVSPVELEPGKVPETSISFVVVPCEEVPSLVAEDSKLGSAKQPATEKSTTNEDLRTMPKFYQRDPAMAERTARRGVLDWYTSDASMPDDRIPDAFAAAALERAAQLQLDAAERVERSATAVMLRARLKNTVLSIGSSCIFLSVACGRDASKADESASATPPAEASIREDPGVGPSLFEHSVDDVWVFTRAQPRSRPGVKIITLDALHTGAPTIVRGCLYVGDSVVIWAPEQIELARQAVMAARAGDTTPVRIGGGGIGLDEGAETGDFPETITARCQPSSIWYANPSSPSKRPAR